MATTPNAGRVAMCAIPALDIGAAPVWGYLSPPGAPIDDQGRPRRLKQPWMRGSGTQTRIDVGLFVWSEPLSEKFDWDSLSIRREPRSPHRRVRQVISGRLESDEVVLDVYPDRIEVTGATQAVDWTSFWAKGFSRPAYREHIKHCMRLKPFKEWLPLHAQRYFESHHQALLVYGRKLASTPEAGAAP